MAANTGIQDVTNLTVDDKCDSHGLKDDGRERHEDARGQVSMPDSHPGVDISGDRNKQEQVQPREIIMTRQEFDAKEYNMKHAQSGRAIVINNKVFKGLDRSKKNAKKREESERDKDGIVKVLNQLGLVGVRYKNKNGQVEEKMVFENVEKIDLLNLLMDAGDDVLNDYKNMDCFICVILSYGEPGAIYCPGKSDTKQDDIVELKQLQEPLKGNRCRTLVMKPKLFFIQGCPYLERDVADAKGKMEAPQVTKKIPIEADFLTQSSHLSGTYGWLQNKNTAMSWYIRALCEALQKFCIDDVKKSSDRRSIHFMTILTRVNRFVAYYMNEDAGILPDRTYQIPLVTSLLTKHLYFYAKS